MKISIATLEDLPSLIKIYNQAINDGGKTADTEPFSYSDRIKWFHEHTSDKFPIFIAKINNEVAGYSTISPYRPGRKALSSVAEVSYYVHYDYHRQGIASSLLKHTIDYSPKLGYKTLIGILIGSNIGSVNLATKFGFKQWGLLPSIVDINGVESDHLYYGLKLES